MSIVSFQGIRVICTMRSLKFGILTSLLSLIVISVSAQRDVRVNSDHLFGWEEDFHPGPRIAFSFQGKPSIEIGVHAILRASPYEDDYGYNVPPPQKKTNDLHPMDGGMLDWVLNFPWVRANSLLVQNFSPN